MLSYPAGRFAEVRTRKEWLSGPDPARFLEAEQIAVVPMARDRRLRAVRQLADPELRRRFLGKLLGARSELAKGDLTLLRYKAGRRLVARLDHRGAPAAILKVYGAADFPRALLGAAAAAALGGAPLLGFCIARRTLVSGWVDGAPLCPAHAGPPSAAALRLTGARLARLHAIPYRPPHGPATKVGLARVAADLAALAPDLARQAAALAASLRRALAPRPSPVAIHGDFSADQVILHDGIPVLIDWDQMAAGDPGQDLGSFLARLDAQAIEGALSAEAAGAAGAALCEGYALGAPLPANLTPHRARGLVLLATEGFRRREPDWPRRTERLLARAEALLAEQRRPPAQGTDLPMLAQALDEGAMRPLLAAALGVAPEALDLRPPQLVREKPGRRALVRYRGAAGDAPFDLLGKLRAKGPDIRTAALHRALRLRGLDGRAPGATGVPASRGRIDVLHLWLQERAPGLTATEFLRPDAPTEAATQTGAALAQLHRADVATARGWSLADESAVLDRALGAAAAEQPREAPRLAAIAGRARALLARLEPVRPTGIHRDFHPDQVLIDGPQVWIVDLDLYASGDPAIDLGNYTSGHHA